MTDDRTDDTRSEDALRRVLALEAQQVQPTGDGLSRIQQRVAARQSRLRWMRPALAGAAAVVVLGGAVGGYAIATNGSGNQTVKYGDGSPSPTAVPVTESGFPAQGIFPFTNAAEEQSWEQQYDSGGSMPWITSPEAVVESWVDNYLKQSGLRSLDANNQPDGATDSVTMGRDVDGSPQPVTVVALQRYGKAWIVTGATDPYGKLQFSDPAADSAVSSPLTVDGPAYGVDEQATVEVRDAETPALFGQATTGPFGNGSAQWSATVPFTTTSDAGVVVATVASAADGRVATLAAEKVTFGKSARPASTTGAGVVYAVQGGTLVTLDPTTGASEGPVSMSGLTGSIGEVRDIAGTVYVTVKGADGCLSTLMSVGTDGATRSVATAGRGYGIVGFDLTPDGSKLTYFESGCGDNAGQAALVFSDLTQGTAHMIQFPSEPPAILGDPVWESDGVHVDAFVRTGMQGYLARYDSTASTQGPDASTPSANACPGYQADGGMQNAVATTAPDGTLWFATQTGTSMQVVSCAGGQPSVEFSVPRNDTPTALAVDDRGRVLLEGATHSVWEWAGHGDPSELSDATGVSSIAW